jgi:Na+-translocating ferredoxin:NAD+ oxidoreductase RnfE subunit
MALYQLHLHLQTLDQQVCWLTSHMPTKIKSLSVCNTYINVSRLITSIDMTYNLFKTPCFSFNKIFIPRIMMNVVKNQLHLHLHTLDQQVCWLNSHMPTKIKSLSVCNTYVNVSSLITSTDVTYNLFKTLCFSFNKIFISLIMINVVKNRYKHSVMGKMIPLDWNPQLFAEVDKTVSATI